MPKLTKKQKAPKKEKREKINKKRRKTEEVLEEESLSTEIVDDTIEDAASETSSAGDSYDEEGVNSTINKSVAVVKPAPYTDGIVSPAIAGLVTVPRVGGAEVSLIHDYLKYLAVTETYIGAITTKWSFMKKRGGRLL